MDESMKRRAAAKSLASERSGEAPVFTGNFKHIDKEVFELQNLYRVSPDEAIADLTAIKAEFTDKK